MDYTDSERYWIWLSALKGMTARRFYRILTEAEDAENVYAAPAEFRHLFDEAQYRELLASVSEGGADKLMDELGRLGISAVTRLSESYPAELEHISDPPVTLFIKGNASLAREKLFAIVGTRRATYDGKKSASEFSKALAENGAVIISGLARGIDTCAHTACLDAGGVTFAVMGNGLDTVYPPENAHLAGRIIDNGGALISELPPGSPPSRYSFPQRNRIIAGLSAGVLVVEGDRKSGSLITANLALEEGREVFAIPGSIYNPLAEGPNHLIQSGAYCALSPYDILESLKWGERPVKKPGRKKPPELDAGEAKVFESLKNEAHTFDEIVNLTGFSVSELNSYLTMLELRGIIIKLPGNLYRLS